MQVTKEIKKFLKVKVKFMIASRKFQQHAVDGVGDKIYTSGGFQLFFPPLNAFGSLKSIFKTLCRRQIIIVQEDIIKPN